MNRKKDTQVLIFRIQATSMLNESTSANQHKMNFLFLTFVSYLLVVDIDVDRSSFQT